MPDQNTETIPKTNVKRSFFSEVIIYDVSGWEMMVFGLGKKTPPAFCLPSWSFLASLAVMILLN